MSYLADHTPSVVVYTHDMVEPVQRAARAIGTVRHLLCMDGAQPGALSLPELMNAQLPAPADPADETAIAHLAYTSGTTGKPKGACLAHEPTMRAARCIAERLPRLSAADHSFGPTALSSSYQLVANLLPPLSRGASVHVMGKWTPNSPVGRRLDSTAGHGTRGKSHGTAAGADGKLRCRAACPDGCASACPAVGRYRRR